MAITVSAVAITVSAVGIMAGTVHSVGAIPDHTVFRTVSHGKFICIDGETQVIHSSLISRANIRRLRSNNMSRPGTATAKVVR